MHIVVCRFSATGNTAAIAEAVAAGLEVSGAQVTRLDITTPDVRERGLDMSAFDAAVVGAPIHSMRAPRLVREWIDHLDGQGKKCAVFLTYGGFQIHPAPYDTARRLREHNFMVVGAADFTGAHSFNQAGWQALADRPDGRDKDLARELAGAVYEKFTGQAGDVVDKLDRGPYTEEQLDKFEGFRFSAIKQLPSRNGTECSLCLLCEERCPSGAMNAELGKADPEKCILCLGCIKNCPEDALQVTDLSAVFKMKMDMDQETPESLMKKRGHLYF